jgi:REP element-mobilizing transposase RayT
MQVFDDMEDYEYFLALLKKASKRENVEVHAYCLMPNHFHLLLVPKEQNLRTHLARKIQKLYRGKRELLYCTIAIYRSQCIQG